MIAKELGKAFQADTPTKSVEMLGTRGAEKQRIRRTEERRTRLDKERKKGMKTSGRLMKNQVEFEGEC